MNHKGVCRRTSVTAGLVNIIKPILDRLILICQLASAHFFFFVLQNVFFFGIKSVNDECKLKKINNKNAGLLRLVLSRCC